MRIYELPSKLEGTCVRDEGAMPQSQIPETAQYRLQFNNPPIIIGVMALYQC